MAEPRPTVMANPPPGHESGPDGELVGRDPRKMDHDELRELGHEPIPALKALRLRCLDCCAGSADEVRKCVAVECPAWPFRLGKSPWKAKRVLTDAQMAALRLRARSLTVREHG